jgi:hypothetical protein
LFLSAAGLSDHGAPRSWTAHPFLPYFHAVHYLRPVVARKQSMIALLVKLVGAPCLHQPALRAGPHVSFDPRGNRFVAGFFAAAVTFCCAAAAGNCRAADASASPEQLITGFADAPSVRAAFHDLNEAAANNTVALRRAALAHLADKDPDAHYAALYALVMTADASNGAVELAGMLTSANVDERLLSAGALAGLGDRRALPVLIAALDQQDELSYRAPPRRAYEFAQSQLLWFTNQDFGLKAAQTPEEIAATKPAWEQWWQSVAGSLHYDRRERKFVE